MYIHENGARALKKERKKEKKEKANAGRLQCASQTHTYSE